MQSKRFHYIDIARGIAILLVIIGHAISSTADPINKFILSFHMPLFFIISGMCLNTESKQKTSAFLKKTITKFIIPQILLGVIWSVYTVFLDYFVNHISVIDSIKNTDLLYNIYRWWFLIVLFFVNLIVFILSQLNCFKDGKRVFIVFVITLLTAFFSLLFFSDKETIGNINVLPVAFLFYIVGYYFKKIISIIEEKQIKKPLLILFVIIGITITAFASHFNSAVSMYNNGYGNLLLFFCSSLFGSFSVILISKLLQENRLLEWYGKNSLYIYVLQFAICNGCYIISHTIANRLNYNGKIPINILSVILSILLTSGITLIISVIKDKAKKIFVKQ